MHTEEDYNSQYGLTAPEPEEGEGLCALLKTHQVDTRGPALEIGCGSGYLTYGLARHYPGPDLLITDPFTPWIEELFVEGITSGCGNGNYCPNTANTRGQMAAFLVRTFALQ